MSGWYSARNGQARACFMCGADISDLHALRKACWDCGDLHDKESRRAISRVGAAVQRGQIRPASEYQCADCGAPASNYDHRDYTEPLMVDPVCGSCNRKRGPAFNSVYRPSAEAA